MSEEIVRVALHAAIVKEGPADQLLADVSVVGDARPEVICALAVARPALASVLLVGLPSKMEQKVAADIDASATGLLERLARSKRLRTLRALAARDDLPAPIAALVAEHRIQRTSQAPSAANPAVSNHLIAAWAELAGSGRPPTDPEDPRLAPQLQAAMLLRAIHAVANWVLGTPRGHIASSMLDCIPTTGPIPGFDLTVTTASRFANTASVTRWLQAKPDLVALRPVLSGIAAKTGTKRRAYTFLIERLGTPRGLYAAWPDAESCATVAGISPNLAIMAMRNPQCPIELLVRYGLTDEPTAASAAACHPHAPRSVVAHAVEVTAHTNRPQSMVKSPHLTDEDRWLLARANPERVWQAATMAPDAVFAAWMGVEGLFDDAVATRFGESNLYGKLAADLAQAHPELADRLAGQLRWSDETSPELATRAAQRTLVNLTSSASARTLIGLAETSDMPVISLAESAALTVG